jgi:transposase
MKDFLSAQEVNQLKATHRRGKDRKRADRIKTILALNEGLTYEETAKLLLLDATTIRRYFRDYQETGIEGLLQDRYHGSRGFLTAAQEAELTIELRTHIYQSVKEICSYIAATYGRHYSVEGMTNLLHRLGFVYKKTKQVPGKTDLSRQEQFIREYKTLKRGLAPKDKIYFLDATHPQHNNMPFYGWIYKGEEKTIKTNSGRNRLNLNGALNLAAMEITVLAEATIDTDAMKRLIRELDRKRGTGDLYLIVDNAKYNHSHKLKEFLRFYSEVHLFYLPPYSPNLNIIERLWRFFHKKYHDRYFAKFKDFEKSVLSFFENINQYNGELKTLLTDSFQTLPRPCENSRSS